ncbi:hypothetical protein [Cellulomonas sp. B6]|uniref:hypothetical protein n=1 Tax=Cellulomonas sp. B6 TaxID=1295626 RepID=UPI000782DA9E|nr:hypothetical protein [Cellulomonas sp. B6]
MSEAVQQPGRGGAVPTPGAVVAAALARDVAPAEAASGADDAVEEALRLLDGVEELELAAQVTTFESVHRALQDRLADAEG